MWVLGGNGEDCGEMGGAAADAGDCLWVVVWFGGLGQVVVLFVVIGCCVNEGLGECGGGWGVGLYW